MWTLSKIASKIQSQGFFVSVGIDKYVVRKYIGQIEKNDPFARTM